MVKIESKLPSPPSASAKTALAWPAARRGVPSPAARLENRPDQDPPDRTIARSGWVTATEVPANPPVPPIAAGAKRIS